MDEVIRKLGNMGHEDLADELEGLKDNMIIDVANFKRELDRQGLKTEKLEEFIDDYIRWDNE